MATDPRPNLTPEIGHVLLLDIVGYSKLLINQQGDLLQTLKQLVQETEPVRAAKNKRDLIRLPTGDGMALIFRNNAEALLECALQLGAALSDHPELRLRMGIHSGPIREVRDVNERVNLAGAGIDVAQRVMDCGDAGHILLSKRVADDLAPYPRWNSQLHDLGECEVKHGVRLHLFNLYSGEFGNSALPSKLQGRTPPAAPVPTRSSSRWPSLAAVVLVLISLGGAAWWFATRGSKPAPALQPVQTAPAISEKSIAVLPFENLSEEKANAYFADGVQDEILTDLAKVADLKVISRTSVIGYRDTAGRNLRKIGQDLGVAHLLEGSVQRAGNRVRVNAQLIDARTDAHLWAQTYDRDLADVFAIQSEIAKTIADQLQAKLSPYEKAEIEQAPTADVAAYDLYVRAKEAFDAAPNSQNPTGKSLRAISLLDQAITRDPSFFAAYCKLAQAHDQLYLLGGDHTAARLTLAEEAINKALQLQPGASEAHLARANHLYSKLDYNNARAELEIARRTLPNDPRVFELNGYIDRRQGRWEESTRNLERALELDPQNFFLLNQISGSYESLREYGKEAAVLDRTLGLRPNDLDAQISRAQLEVIWKADPSPLHTLLAATIRENPRSGRDLAPMPIYLALAERDAQGGAQALADFGDHAFGPDAIQYPRALGEGLFARPKGDEITAQASFARARVAQQAIVDGQPNYGPAVCVLGLINAGLGRKEDALREGRRAAELLPISRDAINGGHIQSLLAMIYAWVGEKDLAIDQLTRTIRLHSSASYGSLQLFPQWDPLRGDPRFEEIVASLAPKETKP